MDIDDEAIWNYAYDTADAIKDDVQAEFGIEISANHLADLLYRELTGDGDM